MAISFARNVIQHESCTSFLRAYYQHKKNENSKFSYELWARSLPEITAPMLRQIVIGKRALPTSRIDVMTKYFKFQTEEKRHFVDLVHLNSDNAKAIHQDLRKKVSDRMNYHKNLHHLQDATAFLENSKIPLLATLLNFSDLKKDIPTFVKFLSAPANQIEKWLSILERLNLAKKIDKFTWENTKKALRLPAQLGNRDLMNFHRQSLLTAAEKVTEPKEKRNFEMMYLALSKKEYGEYLQMVDQFRGEVLARFNTDTLADREVYQVNLAICPAMNLEKSTTLSVNS